MTGGPVTIVGFAWSPQAHEVKDFLARLRVPYRWLDFERSAEARRLLEEVGAGAGDTPVLRFPDGAVLRDPTPEALAEQLGLSTAAEYPFYDLVVIGAGPAGLSAAVYAASEGLRTVVLETIAPGGQAAMSAGIENYLGFPEGISGAELGRRSVAQAERFGAEVIVACTVRGLRAEGPYRVVTLDDDTELYAHAVLLATGVSWRVLRAPGCERLVGRGVYYGSAAAEASTCRGEDVYLVGGGNSAGQAALYLARYARNVTLAAPEPSFAERMSEYLLERIEALPNVRLRPGTLLVNAAGEERLETVTLKDVETGEEEEAHTGALFVFIGAAPETAWLEGVVAMDEEGFVRSGPGLPRDEVAWPLERDPYPLETSVPGVFVAGDGRAGSVKRVGAAVGEGATVVDFLHRYLRES